MYVLTYSDIIGGIKFKKICFCKLNFVFENLLHKSLMKMLVAREIPDLKKLTAKCDEKILFFYYVREPIRGQLW